MCDRKILITGAGGYIGSHLTVHLMNRVCIRAVYRNSPMINLDVDTFVVGDISGHTNWDGAFEDVETIVHLAALAHESVSNNLDAIDIITDVNVNASINFFKQAEKAGVKRFIFVSSIGVIGNQTQEIPFDEDSECNPIGAYACSKYEAEKLLMKLASESTTELVIVRPPLVFSPSAPGNIAKLSKIIKYCPILPFALVKNKKSFVSIENLVNFLELCIFNPDAAGQIFVISDDKVWSTKQLIQKLAELEGRNVYFIPIPVVILKMAFTLIGKESMANQLFGNLLVSNKKARDLLYWKPIF